MTRAQDHRKDNTPSGSHSGQLASAKLPSGLAELPLDQIELGRIQIVDFDKMADASEWQWFGRDIKGLIFCEQKLSGSSPIKVIHKVAKLLVDKAVPYQRQIATLRHSIAELRSTNPPWRLSRALDKLDRSAGQALRRGWAYHLREVKNTQAENAASCAECAFDILVKGVLFHDCSEGDWKAVVDAAQVWLTEEHGQDNNSPNSIPGTLIRLTEYWEKLIDNNEQIDSLGIKEMRVRLSYIYETTILPMIRREIDNIREGLDKSKLAEDAPRNLREEWGDLKLLAHSPSEDQLFSPSDAAAYLQATKESAEALVGLSYLRPVLERFLVREDSAIYPETNLQARWLLTLIRASTCFRINLAGDLITTNSQARAMLENQLKVEERFEELRD